MTSLFDTTVYHARRAVEWAEIDLGYFLKDLAQNDRECRPVTLEVHARPSVRTRFWWTLSWFGADGQEHWMAGETLQLCLWRAAVRERQLRAKAEREEQQEHAPECECEECSIARLDRVTEAEARMRAGE